MRVLIGPNNMYLYYVSPKAFSPFVNTFYFFIHVMFTESIVTLKECDVEFSAKVTVLRTHEPKKWFKKHQSVCCCCCVDTSLAKKIPVTFSTEPVL